MIAVSALSRYTADEQNATRPPRGVLDAFCHVTNSLRPASNIQCLHRNHQICVSKNTQATHTCLSRTTNTARRPATRNDTSPHAWLEFRGFITVGLRATEARRKAIGECTVCRGTRLSADRRGLRYRSERKTQSIGMPLRRTLTSSRASSKKGSWQYASVLELCWTSRSFCLKYGGYEQWKD